MAAVASPTALKEGPHPFERPAMAHGADQDGEPEIYLEGHVKTYSTRKGFGFITSEELQTICGGDIFVYNTHLVGRIGLIAGEKVEFVLFYDPLTLRPQARNVRVIEPAPTDPGVPASAAPVPEERLEELQKIKTEAMKRAQEKGAGGGGAALQSSASKQALSSSPGGAAGGQADMAAKVRQAQEDASKKVRHDAAMLFELEWAQHNPDFHNAPTYYPAPPSGAGGYPQQQRAPPPPKTLIPVGSEVTIIDFPVRDLNGQKGIVKHYEEKSGRYKIEVQDPKKGAQEFLMPKEKLRIDTLTLPNAQDTERRLREKQLAAKEILENAIQGNHSRNLDPRTAAALTKFEEAPQNQMMMKGKYGEPLKGPPGSAKGMPPPGAVFPPGHPAAGKGMLPPGAAPQQPQMMPGMQPGYGPQIVKGPGGKPMVIQAPMAQPGKPVMPRHPHEMPVMPRHPHEMPQPVYGKGPQQAPMKGPEDPYGKDAFGGKDPFHAAAAAAKGGNPAPDIKGHPVNKGQQHPNMPQQLPGKQGVVVQHLPHTNNPPQQGKMPPVEQPVSPPQPKPRAPTPVAVSPAAKQASPEKPPNPLDEPKTAEEMVGVANTWWRVRKSQGEFNDAIVRADADMSSKEVKRMLPGDWCMQTGPTVRVDPGVVRMPIGPAPGEEEGDEQEVGWVTVHARIIGGPTFLELVPKEEVERRDKAAKEEAMRMPRQEDYGEVEGLDIAEKTYPLSFMLRFKLVVSELDEEHPCRQLQVAKLAESGRGGRGGNNKKPRRDERPPPPRKMPSKDEAPSGTPDRKDSPNDEEPPAKPAWDQKKKTSGWDDAWGADKDWYGGEWGAGNWGGGEDWNDWSYGTTDYKRSAKGAGRDQQRDSKGTRGKHGTAAGERDNGTDKSPRSGEKEQKGEQAGSRYDQEKGGSVRQRPERKTAANGASPGEGGAKKASPEHAKGPRKVEYKVDEGEDKPKEEEKKAPVPDASQPGACQQQ